MRERVVLRLAGVDGWVGAAAPRVAVGRQHNVIGAHVPRKQRQPLLRGPLPVRVFKLLQERRQVRP